MHTIIDFYRNNRMFTILIICLIPVIYSIVVYDEPLLNLICGECEYLNIGVIAISLLVSVLILFMFFVSVKNLIVSSVKDRI